MANLTAPRNTPEFAPNNTLAGTGKAVVDAGYALASQRIVKEYARMFRQAAKGQKPT